MTDPTMVEFVEGADAAGADPAVDIDPRTWSALDRLSRSLHVQGGDLQQTLDAALRIACQVIDGADAAGLNLFVRGRFEPQAVFGEGPHELDLVQRSSGVGPCIDASREQAVVEIIDTHAESRWPEFTARALEVGVLSMLCVPLWVDDVRLGSVSLYSTSTRARFTERDRLQAAVFATHAALALTDAQRVANLKQALINRDVIGQAKGILMARHRVTADTAFAWLSAASQAQNVKLVKIAETVTLTGELPGPT